MICPFMKRFSVANQVWFISTCRPFSTPFWKLVLFNSLVSESLSTQYLSCVLPLLTFGFPLQELSIIGLLFQALKDNTFTCLDSLTTTPLQVPCSMSLFWYHPLVADWALLWVTHADSILIFTQAFNFIILVSPDEPF